jgi:hypothetical protein
MNKNEINEMKYIKKLRIYGKIKLEVKKGKLK